MCCGVLSGAIRVAVTRAPVRSPLLFRIGEALMLTRLPADSAVVPRTKSLKFCTVSPRKAAFQGRRSSGQGVTRSAKKLFGACQDWRCSPPKIRLAPSFAVTQLPLSSTTTTASFSTPRMGPSSSAASSALSQVFPVLPGLSFAWLLSGMPSPLCVGDECRMVHILAYRAASKCRSSRRKESSSLADEFHSPLADNRMLFKLCIVVLRVVSAVMRAAALQAGQG